MVYSCGGLRAVSDIYLVRHSPRGNIMKLYIFERILCTYLPAVVVGESVRPIVPGGLRGTSEIKKSGRSDCMD